MLMRILLIFNHSTKGKSFNLPAGSKVFFKSCCGDLTKKE